MTFHQKECLCSIICPSKTNLLQVTQDCFLIKQALVGCLGIVSCLYKLGHTYSQNSNEKAKKMCEQKWGVCLLICCLKT
jgi:hypothetical protein